MWPWRHLLRRGPSSREAPPVEVLIRVEGKGLSNVTQAWVGGLPATRSGRGGKGAAARRAAGKTVIACQSLAPLA